MLKITNMYKVMLFSLSLFLFFVGSSNVIVSEDTTYTAGLPTSPSPPLKTETNGNSKGWSNSPSLDENKGELKI